MQQNNSLPKALSKSMSQNVDNLIAMYGLTDESFDSITPKEKDLSSSNPQKLLKQQNIFKTSKRSKGCDKNKKHNLVIRPESSSLGTKLTVHPISSPVGIKNEDVFKSSGLVIKNEGDVFKKLGAVGPYNVYFRDIKTLDLKITVNELNIIHKIDRNFITGWLTDTIIDSYLYSVTKNKIGIKFFDTGISQMVETYEEKIPLDVLNLKQIAKNSNFIFMPTNPSRAHWILLVLNLQTHELGVYDPYLHTNEKHNPDSRAMRLLNIWKEIYRLQRNVDLRLNYPDHKIQKDSYNCGVFVCWFVNRLVNNLPLTDNNYDINCFRTDILNLVMFDMKSDQTHH